MIKILKAIIYATWKHRNQKRKITGRPYVLHPLSAGYTLYKCGFESDLIIAAILHDVLEDTDTESFAMEEVFGTRITNLVRSVSNNYKVPTSLENMSINTLCIKTADTLDNVRDYIKYDGGVSFEHFLDYEKKLRKTYDIISTRFNFGPYKQLTREIMYTLADVHAMLRKS